MTSVGKTMNLFSKLLEPMVLHALCSGTVVVLGRMQSARGIRWWYICSLM